MQDVKAYDANGNELTAEYNAETGDSGNVTGVGSSNGGCESGFGIFALIIATGFMTLSEKR